MSLHEPRFVPSHPRRERPPRCRAQHGAGHSGVQHLSPLLCSLLFSYSTTQIWERALAPLHQSLATTNLAPSGVLWGGGSSCKRGAPSAQTASTHCTDWWEQPQLVPRVPKPSQSPHLPFTHLQIPFQAPALTPEPANPTPTAPEPAAHAQLRFTSRSVLGRPNSRPTPGSTGGRGVSVPPRGAPDTL